MFIVDFFTNELYGFYDTVAVILIVFIAFIVIKYKLKKNTNEVRQDDTVATDKYTKKIFCEYDVDKKLVEILREGEEIDSLRGLKTFNDYDAFELAQSIINFIDNSEKIGKELNGIKNADLPLDLSVSTYYCSCEIIDLKQGVCEVSINLTDKFIMNINSFFNIKDFQDLEKYMRKSLVLHRSAYY